MLIQEVEDEPSGTPTVDILRSCQNSSIEERIATANTVHASLSQDPSGSSTETTEDLIEAVELLSNLIKPEPKLFVEEHPQRIKDEQVIEQWHTLTGVVLDCISLASASLPAPTAINSAAIITLLAYTDPSSPWCSPSASTKAFAILSFSTIASSPNFIINNLLSDFIRPLFKDSKPDSVTSQGRKNTTPNVVQQKFSPSGLYDPVKRPWKYRDVHAATVLQWAVEKSDEKLIAESWHLFIPPLLTLVDDISTPYKLKGMALLTALLPKLPTRILEQTGLGDVIEEAILPILAYLPTLTPTDESKLLLRAAYDALFKLMNVRFQDKANEAKKQKLIDKLLRKGIFYAYHHCPDNLTIVLLLLEVVGEVINRAGIEATKHLKDILPILYTILMDPFAPANPPTLIQAIKTLQIVILNCWVVITTDRHRHELIKALIVAWLNVNEEIQNGSSAQKDVLQAAKQELAKTGPLFIAAATTEPDVVKNEVAQLVAAQPELSGLFGP